jgi:putative membrane protein
VSSISLLKSRCLLERTSPIYLQEEADASDPCDLNLDLFCVELRCECEAIIERLPEGDEDDLEDMLRIWDDDGADGGDDY